MQTWAHITDGVVNNVVVLGDKVRPGTDLFAPSYAKDMRKAPEGTKVGALFDGSNYTAPPEAAPAVPDAVDAVYALIQLSRTPTKDEKSDLLTATKEAVGKAGAEVQVWFERAQRWRRADPYIAQIGAALGLSDADMDALFVAAAKIPFETAAT